MPDEEKDTLATSPKDPTTDAIKPSTGPTDGAGTEAEEAVGKSGAPLKPSDGEMPASRKNSVHPETK